MKLSSAQITNFKCIEDSGKHKISQVTCYVGKNEAGKSTLLQALYKLNPSIETDRDFDPVYDYPRRLYSSYKERHETKPDTVLTTEWTLLKQETEEITRTIRVPKPVKKVTIKKDYKNELKIYIDGKERTGINLASKIEELLPTFVYFTDYDKMLGNVSLTELNQLKSQNKLKMPHRIFMALLSLVGTTPEALSSIGKYEELSSELEAVSARISSEIFEYWSQNQYLEVEFRFTHASPNDPAPYNSGLIFRTRIKNTRHRVTVNFDERSVGFIWFFSFLVWFSQLKQTYGKNLVVLLDDPGLSLHAKAQADLLRYINEKLSPNFQVLYTTHSPFMIDPSNLLNVRTVEDALSDDGEVLGTKIREDILHVDPDTIFPLQAALGYDLTQTLFVGKNVLLVEGPSDLLYLKWASRMLEQSGREGLDSRWVITPSGGISKVGTFMRLFGSNDLNVAILTDFHKGIKSHVRSLKESGLLQASHVYSADMFVESDEADVEDMLGRDCYIHLVNRCYVLKGNKRIPKVKPKSAPNRVIKEVEDRLKSKGIHYNHYSPAVYLTENPKVFDKLASKDESLETFEILFKEINTLI